MEENENIHERITYKENPFSDGFNFMKRKTIQSCEIWICFQHLSSGERKTTRRMKNSSQSQYLHISVDWIRKQHSKELFSVRVAMNASKCSNFPVKIPFRTQIHSLTCKWNRRIFQVILSYSLIVVRTNISMNIELHEIPMKILTISIESSDRSRKTIFNKNTLLFSECFQSLKLNKLKAFIQIFTLQKIRE